LCLDAPLSTSLAPHAHPEHLTIPRRILRE
jgi:hypothetical protein